MSIDDFGTGYSSLASLKNLSVDELKIDQSFIQAMATDASSRAIVRAIIDLADTLRLRVVAEGVEDQATWDVLVGLGCDLAQRYFLSRPVAAPELEVWIAQIGPSWLAMAERSQVDGALQERIQGVAPGTELWQAYHCNSDRSRWAPSSGRVGSRRYT